MRFSTSPDTDKHSGGPYHRRICDAVSRLAMDELDRSDPFRRSAGFLYNNEGKLRPDLVEEESRSLAQRK